MISIILENLRQVAAFPEAVSGLVPHVQQMGQLSESEVEDLLMQVVELVEMPELTPRRESLDQGVQTVFQGLMVWRQSHSGLSDSLQSRYQELVDRLYRWAGPESMLRNFVLHWLSFAGTESKPFEPSLKRWADLICEDPPEHRSSIPLAFGPLMQREYDPPMWLLEKLLREGIVHSQIAPAVFDLFNFFFRTGVLQKHPVADRADELTALAGKIGDSLYEIEQGKKGGQDPATIGKQVSDSVAMLVALADSMALIEYRPAAERLKGLLKLKHRRVQTEVASALARLGEPEGKQALIELAEEPVCRMRVLAYAEELGFENEISLEYRGDIALAESELAIWLSEPQQVGVAPTQVRLLDSREMFWPSYEGRRCCYLFEYVYGQGEQATRNIGIAGPLTYAFPADLTHLSIDDAYALFAGWQSSHPEIYLMSAEKAAQAFSNDWRRIMAAIEDSEWTERVVETAAGFFGRVTAVVSCQSQVESEGASPTPGTAIFDTDEHWFISAGNAKAPVSWELALCIWRGRQLLSTFNPSE